MRFHFKEERDSTNYGPNLTDYAFPFPSIGVLPSRDGKNMGNTYLLFQLHSMDALTYVRKHSMNANACVLIQFTTT